MSNTVRYNFKNQSIEFESPSFKEPVPLFLIFKVLGIETDRGYD